MLIIMLIIINAYYYKCLFYTFRRFERKVVPWLVAKSDLIVRLRCFIVDFTQLFPKCCKLRYELRSEVQKFIIIFTNRFVNNAFDWLIFVQGPIKGFVYKPACEFQHELLNFLRNEVRNIQGKVM
jgi:hypothetical protein